MSAWYRAVVTLGDDADYSPEQTFTLERSTEHVEVTDQVAVLDGLRFGWKHPESALYPLQPDPMTAALAITMPAFIDAPWMNQGSPVAIECWLDDTTDALPHFTFYGRISDDAAVPRSTDPGPRRSGVTLSLNAVDYTIDPLEAFPQVPGVVIVNPSADQNWLENGLWANVGGLGAFPTWVTPTANVYIENFGGARELIDQVLFTAIAGADVLPAFGAFRAIFAPLIDPDTKRPDTTQPWTFDRVFKTPQDNLTVGKLERASLAWGQNKRTAPNVVTINGAPNDPDSPYYPGAPVTATNAGAGRPYTDVQTTVDTVSNDLTRMSDLADFYLPDPTRPDRGWTLPTVRWLLTQEDPDTLPGLPRDLMPRHDYPDGDPFRSLAYSRLLELGAVADDLNPYATTDHPELLGLLAGVDLSINRGHIALDLTIRNLQEESE